MKNFAIFIFVIYITFSSCTSYALQLTDEQLHLFNMVQNIDKSSLEDYLSITTVDLNFICCNITGDTLLHEAALTYSNIKSANSLDIFKILLDFGANINTKNKFGQTALWYVKDCLEIFKLLGKLTFDINSQNITGETYLHIAINNNYLDVITILLELGADPYIKSSIGNSAWDIANRTKNTRVINLIKTRPLKYQLISYINKYKNDLINQEQLNSLPEEIKEKFINYNFISENY